MPYYVGRVIRDRQRLLLATPERYRDWFGIEVRTRHEVRRIDRAAHTVEVMNIQTGAVFTRDYDALVLALGAAPVRPPLPGFDLPGVFSLRNLADLDAMCGWMDQHEAAHAVVIGASFLGLEMADNLVRRGLEVTLLEMSEQVMPLMDAEMVAPVSAELAKQGVAVRLGQRVAAIEPAGAHRLNVITQTKERFPADVVLLAMGVRPDVRLAQECGLEIGALGGIRVDDQMRTSDPAIFAVGDAVEVRDFVTGRTALVPLAGPANRQGRLVADVICGRDAHFRGTQGTGVVGVFDLTLATTGATEKSLNRAGVAYQRIYTHLTHHAAYYPGAELLTMKLLFSPSDGRVLGAQAVGRAGVDKRIDVVAFAIQTGATVYDLEEAELSYAPQYGSAKDPLNMAGFVAGNILRGDVDPAQWDEWKIRQESPETAPLVVDVRTPTEYAAASVPGAINIPLGELRARLGELPRDREIWVHCGVGQRSYYASRILKQRGFQVRNLAGGMRSYQTLLSTLG